MLARSAFLGVLLFVGYYLLPLDKTDDIGPLLLIGGLIRISVVVTWQVRATLHAGHAIHCHRVLHRRVPRHRRQNQARPHLGTIEMLFNVVVLGLVAKVMFGAVDTGRKDDQPNTTNRRKSEINQNGPPTDPLQEPQSERRGPIP